LPTNLKIGDKKDRAPRPEDFSKRAVERAVFHEAIQHPTTLYPAAVSLLGVAYMLLVNLNPASVGVALISGLLSIVSGIFHYFVRGESIAETYIKNLKEKRNQYKEQQAGDIEAECKAAGFLEGEKEARELKHAYTQLYNFLKEKLEKKRVLTAERFIILAEETYLQGLQLLRKALLMFNTLKQIDYEKLSAEKKTFEQELQAQEKRGDDSRKPIIDAIKAKIQSHEKRIKLYLKRKETQEQLMAQCEVLEATLDTTFLEVVDLIGDETFKRRSSVAKNLERAVAAARKVEERLRGSESEISDYDYSNHYEKEN